MRTLRGGKGWGIELIFSRFVCGKVLSSLLLLVTKKTLFGAKYPQDGFACLLNKDKNNTRAAYFKLRQMTGMWQVIKCKIHEMLSQVRCSASSSIRVMFKDIPSRTVCMYRT